MDARAALFGVTMTVPTAAKILNMSVRATYIAAERGDIPTMRIGKKILVLCEPLRQRLGVAGQSEKAA